MKYHRHRILHRVLIVIIALLTGVFTSGPFAILVGIVCAFTIGTPNWSTRAAQLILAFSVVCLGASMNLTEVAQIGLNGLLLTALTLLVTFGAGFLLSRKLDLPQNLITLITVGTAICGGSAIAAVAPLLRAKASEIAASLGVVFLLNAAALYLFPILGQALQMDPQNYGLWCAFAIHDTSSVVGAAAAFGPEALATATITKLSRALWIVPVSLSLSLYLRTKNQTNDQAIRARIPVFIWAFLLMVALVTIIPALRPAGQVLAQGGRHGMVMALFFIGLALNPQTLKQVSGKALVFGASLWVLLAAGTLWYFIR